MVAALGMIWLIEKTGFILIYGHSFRVQVILSEVLTSCNKEVWISLGMLYAFHGETQLWEAEFLI